MVKRSGLELTWSYIGGETRFTKAEGSKVSVGRREECHGVITKFIVKGLQPFSTVEVLG